MLKLFGFGGLGVIALSLVASVLHFPPWLTFVCGIAWGITAAQLWDPWR